MSTATENSVDRTVAPKQLIALIKDAEQKGKRIQSIAGELGERIKSAVENGHLHRGAFRLMLRLYKMDEENRGDFMRSIGLYMQICHEEGLFGRETGDMFEDTDDVAAGGEGETKPHYDVKSPDDLPDVRPPFLRRDIDAEAAVQNASLLKDGIKQLPDDPDGEDTPKPKRGRKKAALEGADAEGSYTSVN